MMFITSMFKSMAGLSYIFISLLHGSAIFKNKVLSMSLILIIPVISLFGVYLVNLVYTRQLWESIGTRLSILIDFDLYGYGLGYGTNIIINATEAADNISRISDGTLSLLKFQFGIFGYAWGVYVVYYCLKIAMKGNTFMGFGLLVAVLSINIPEVAFLSLLIPSFLFGRFKNE